MVEDYLPLLGMVLVQFGYAVMNIVVKLAMDYGMNIFILVAYRQIFGALAILPFAYFLERKTRPTITTTVLFQAFLCSIGATLSQILYFSGLKYSSPTLSSALINLLPAVTFLLAVLVKLEGLKIKKTTGQAKVIGTAICIGGAMVLTFYRGHAINVSGLDIHLKYVEELKAKRSNNESNFPLGASLVMACCVAWALWLIVQGIMSQKFPAPYTSSFLTCFMGSIEGGIIGLLVEHNIAAWSLCDPIILVTVLYSGIVCTALTFCMISWTIQKRGPLYVSVFNPLLLVMVAILSWVFLNEKIHVGTVIGSVFVVVGLYAVLWGKVKEENQRREGSGI